MTVALRTWVPTHGFSMRVTGGRSTSLSIPGTSPTGTGRDVADLRRAGAAAGAGEPHSALTAAARSMADASRSTGPAPMLRLTVVVVTWPVRATPTTSVLTGALQDRSTSRSAWSPTLSSAAVLSSCIRRSRQPAYQPTAVRKACLAARSLTDSSETCTADRAGRFFSGVVPKRRSSAWPPSGSA